MSAPPVKQVILNCENKRRFSDEFAARAAAQERLQKIGQMDGLGIYRCPHCKGWHLTSRTVPRYFRVTDTDVYPKLTEENAR